MLDVSNVLTRIVEELDVAFTLKEKSISIQDAFATTGLLPAMARRADQISTLCLGYGIGISFDEADNAELGVKVIFDDVTPQTLRVLCIYDVILDIINYSDDKKNISLDELLYD